MRTRNMSLVREENAYLTVEAAMVFPVVISAILFVIYILLFQYDRCLLEQDMGAMALWGSRVEFADTAALTAKTRERIAGISLDKYAMWEITALDASLERKRFVTEGGGQLTFPVPGWNFWSAGNVWGAEAGYGYDRLSPVHFIRLCHRFLQGRGEDDAAENEGGG